jgi:hypothetical protein
MALFFHGANRPDTSVTPHRWFSANDAELARRELAPVLAQYEEALRPAGRDFVELMVGTLSAAFPLMKGTDADAMLKLELYVLALSEFPPDLLAEAARTALRCCTFFPTVAELLRAGDPDDGVEQRFLSRVRTRNDLASKLNVSALPEPQPARLGAPRSNDLDVLMRMADRYRTGGSDDKYEMPIA